LAGPAGAHVLDRARVSVVAEVVVDDEDAAGARVAAVGGADVVVVANDGTAPWHDPPLHVSPVVQKLLSSHGALLLVATQPV
jgi:hypothetical protein